MSNSVKIDYQKQRVWCKQLGAEVSDRLDVENSDKFREEGNRLYTQGQFFAAIAQYNKALIYARKDPYRMAMCYSNRSAVYLKLEYFAHCLNNISLAEPHYPKDKIQKLHDRRQQCLVLMAKCDEKSLADLDHDFKLSYEPNKRLPFFIDAIEMREDDTFGKQLITTRDLKAGDVIAVIDKPLGRAIYSIHQNHPMGCYTCFKTNNGDLVPGDCAGEN